MKNRMYVNVKIDLAKEQEKEIFVPAYLHIVSHDSRLNTKELQAGKELGSVINLSVPFEYSTETVKKEETSWSKPIKMFVNPVDLVGKIKVAEWPGTSIYAQAVS